MFLQLLLNLKPDFRIFAPRNQYMHTIIADTGSTKADWLWIHQEKIVDTQSTFGFNPFNSDGESFINAAQRALKEWPLQAKDLHIHYYGSGCKSEINKAKTRQLLRMLCPQSTEIYVNSDILGVCHACCGNKPGIAAILGTGMNSCLYDGEKIIDRLPSLGYLGGDPASGYDLGKRIIQAYAWRELPEAIAQDIERSFTGGIDQIIKELHEAVQPNVFLASFTPYLTKFRNTPFVKTLVSDAFDEFIISNLAKYDKPNEWKVYFVGSIAHFFQEELTLCLEKNGMHLGKVIIQPGQAMAQYIMKQQEKSNG